MPSIYYISQFYHERSKHLSDIENVDLVNSYRAILPRDIDTKIQQKDTIAKIINAALILSTNAP